MGILRGCGGMADASDSKSDAARHVGSTPTTPTSSHPPSPGTDPGAEPTRWVPRGMALARNVNRILGKRWPAVVAWLARRHFLIPRRLPARPWELAGLGLARPVEILPGLAGLHWEGAGPRILCLHGWEGRASHFLAVGDRLAQRGFEVWSLDGPAHGRSVGRLAHPVAFAEALLAVDAVHGPFHGVIGHSMGAASVAYARTLGLRAERLVLMAGPLRSAEVLGRFMDMMELVEAARGPFVRMVESLVGRPVSLLDLAALAPHLDRPGLIIHGTADPDVPWQDAEVLAAAWPESDLMLLEGVGHRRILRDEVVLDRIEAFLETEDSV